MSDEDTLLNAIKRKIPGYGAYRDQESRRDDDRLTREFLAKRIGDCKNALDAMGAAAVAQGDLSAPMEIERLRSQLDHAQTRLSGAVEGYSGWFSNRTVDAELLTDVAKLDENLVSLVDQIESLIKTQQESVQQKKSADAHDLNEAIQRLHARIDRRTEILKRGN